MTDSELRGLRDAHCPFCPCDTYLEGPSLGLSIEAECPDCHAVYIIQAGGFTQWGAVCEEPVCNKCALPKNNHEETGACFDGLGVWTSPAPFKQPETLLTRVKRWLERFL